MTDSKKPLWQPQKITAGQINPLAAQNPGMQILDTYREQLEEVFLLRNPKYRFDKNYQDDFKAFLDSHLEGSALEEKGAWYYYPWLNSVIHVLDEILYFEMRTGRNKNLITGKEQQKYYDSSIGILGMSVGSHAALTIAMTGGPKNLKLADPDTISGSNLNRIRTGVQNIGLSKVILVARLIYEINPYSNISIYPNGVTEDNIGDFLDGGSRLDVLVEEMDNPYMKLKIREEAKLLGIPVVMATDNGDNIFVDIERFDTSPSLPLLNGIAEGLTSEQFKNLSPKELPKTAAKLAGAQMATLRMQKSVLEVGKTLYSWPQLGTAANLCGSAVAYLARKIAVGESNISSGRYQVNMDAIFEADYWNPKIKDFRESETAKFLSQMGL